LNDGRRRVSSRCPYCYEEVGDGISIEILKAYNAKKKALQGPGGKTKKMQAL
jgi:hypothetical protein